MNCTPNRVWFDRALVVLFCIGIMLPPAAWITGWTTPFDPHLERRLAAAWPELVWRHRGPLPFPSYGSVKSAPKQIELYFNDRYGFRSGLLGLYAKATAAGWIPKVIESHTEQLRVLVGRNQWLFLTGISLDAYRSKKPYGPVELAGWEKLLRERRRWLADRNCEFVFLVAPDKPTVYPEYLPASITRVRNQSRLDQLIEHMNKSGELQVLDVRAALQAAKSERHVFYQGDTHWNSYGAWLGYCEVFNQLARTIPGLRPQTLDDYTLVPGTGRLGDLAHILQSSDWPESGDVVFEPKRPPGATLSGMTIDLGNGEYVEGRRYVNPSAQLGCAVVLNDSFFIGMIPFFTEHFREVISLSHARPFPVELIERVRPSVVFLEMVERHLIEGPPTNPPLPALRADEILPVARRSTAVETR